jgi:hypothetical protein
MTDALRGKIRKAIKDSDLYVPSVDKETVNEVTDAILTLIRESLPEKKPSPKGKDCKCAAYYCGECGCSADWSDYDEWNAYHDAMMEVLK